MYDFIKKIVYDHIKYVYGPFFISSEGPWARALGPMGPGPWADPKNREWGPWAPQGPCKGTNKEYIGNFNILFPESDELRDLFVYVFHWGRVVVPGASRGGAVELPPSCRRVAVV